jgi:hypothetical protein
VLADEQAGAPGMLQKGGEGGHLVVEPGAGEADGEHQGRPDIPQAFVKIGCLLVRDAVNSAWGKCGTGFGVERIEVADHGRRIVSKVYSARRAPIGGYEEGCVN